MKRKIFNLPVIGSFLAVLMCIVAVACSFSDRLYDCLPERIKINLHQLGPEAAYKDGQVSEPTE